MKRSFKNIFRALTVRNYRLFFMGQGISLIGTWIQRTTMGWYVYRLTNSVFLLGFISFLSMIPSVFISPFAGAWADKFNRHKIIIMTQTALLIQTALLASSALTGFINSSRLYPLFILAIMQGIIEGVDAPIRQSFVIDMVQIRSMVPNAIAMNSAMFNGARLFGPAIGGFLIATVGESICFLINSISYIPVIIMLLMMKIEYIAKAQTAESTFRKIMDGWSYAWHHFPIRYLVMNIAVYTLFGMSYATLLPVFARDVLSGDSNTLGIMMSAIGIGALTGSLFLASRTTIKGLPARMMGIGVIVSMALIGFAASNTLWISLPLMPILGLGLMMQMASTNTLIQSIVDDKMRGRVSSIYTMAFTAVTPFGSLMVGSLSSRIGVQLTMGFSAVVCLLWSLNGFGFLAKFTRGIFRLLILSDSRDMYRVKNLSYPKNEEALNASL